MNNAHSRLLERIYTVYYLSVLVNVTWGMQRFLGREMISDHFTGIPKVLGSVLAPMHYDSFFVVFAATTAAAAAFPRFSVLRTAQAICLALLFSLFFSFGKTNFHSYHAFIYVCFALAILPPTATKSWRTCVLTGLWAILLMNYTTSGLWKIYGAFDSSSFGRIWDDLRNVFTFHFAYAEAEGSLEKNLIQEFLLGHKALGGLVWLLVILLESGAFLAIFSRRLRVVWALSLAAMHYVIGLSMGIWFVPAILSLGFLLLLDEEQLFSSNPAETC